MRVEERAGFRINGFPVLVGVIALVVGGLAAIVYAANVADDVATQPLAVGLGLWLVAALVAPGLFPVQPNESRVLVFLGNYVGSVRDSGFFWTNPFAQKKRVSLRVRNFNSDRLKVNDAHGNPIEIAAVVVWSVVDSARALFDVDNYESFVSIQAETAIRALASRYPYDQHEDGRPSLRGSPDEIASHLKQELEARLLAVGVRIEDARISHLAYAPEIAHAMLRRQQAQAIIAARMLIVEGAVSMVQMALERLEEHEVVELNEERKASMVSNLLVVLVGDSETQPVINAGTLY